MTSRTYYNTKTTQQESFQHPSRRRQSTKSSSVSEVQRDRFGRAYQDFYFLLCENWTDGLESIILKAKRLFAKYPKLVNWDIVSPTPAEARSYTISAVNISTRGISFLADSDGPSLSRLEGGWNSTASEGIIKPELLHLESGNFLEMITLGLEMHATRHKDRDMAATGITTSNSLLCRLNK